jgi:hypothetical protein
LDQDELRSVMQLARAAAKQTGDFNKGLETALARLLASPNFIFRVEHVQTDPDTGRTRLDDYSVAARISFLLWNAPPDETLLDAAASGALREKRGLETQVERLMASPHFEQGMRAFFSDMFAYERFDNLSKDQSLFPSTAPSWQRMPGNKRCAPPWICCSPTTATTASCSRRRRPL